jgi:hypothetical protein
LIASLCRRREKKSLRIEGCVCVFPDGSDQRRKDPIRVLERFTGLQLFDLLPKVLFLFPGKGNELDARPVPDAALLAPHQHSAPLPVNTLLEPDDAGLKRQIGLNAEAKDAVIHDLAKMVCPREIMKRNDSQGAVTLHGDGVPLHTLPLSISSIIHDENTIIVMVTK